LGLHSPSAKITNTTGNNFILDMFPWTRYTPKPSKTNPSNMFLRTYLVPSTRHTNSNPKPHNQHYKRLLAVFNSKTSHSLHVPSNNLRSIGKHINIGILVFLIYSLIRFNIINRYIPAIHLLTSLNIANYISDSSRFCWHFL